LGEVDAGCSVFSRPEHGRIRISNRFKEGEAGGNDANSEQERPELRDMCCRNKPEPADCHHQETGDDASFVTKLGREPSRRKGHEEVTQIMRELHPRGLRQGQMQLLLKMFVHHINHPVAKSP
jgi:hypothetical protein